MATRSTAQRFSLVESGDHADLDAFASEVRKGLGAQPKTLPCRFFYDEQGSLLFEEICALPEYYPTRAEREILEARADEIAARFPEPVLLGELGSGSSAKTRLLIEAFLRRHGALSYAPIDISRSMLEASSLELLERYGALDVHAIAAEYRAGLRHLSRHESGTKLVAWLGSNIGNFDRPEAQRFLTAIAEALAPRDRLLVGIDLRKDREVLERAYDDAQGVTARFNVNLLARINRELGGHFDLESFEHRAVWRPDPGRVEIHLVSKRPQRVGIDDLDLAVEFAEGESIHTENSYKYAPEEIDALAEASGLRVERRWLDGAERFSLSLLARS